MSVHETSDIRELSATELDCVVLERYGRSSRAPVCAATS
jgi:hypothetical protein